METVELFKDNYCYSCHKKLKELFPGQITNYQFDGALWIEFHGGYGMFIDPVFESNPKVVICEQCAYNLMEKVPWVKWLLQPEE